MEAILCTVSSFFFSASTGTRVYEPLWAIVVAAFGVLALTQVIG